MGVSMAVSRHILGQSEEWVINENKKDYEGLDRTIEGMAEEAFGGASLKTIGEATEAGTQLGIEWGSELDVCDVTGNPA